jgi:hypothetical protein
VTTTTVAPRRRLSATVRRAVLTTHITASVALLGDSAGFLAVAIRTAGVETPVAAAAGLDTLNMFSLVFGIPLSVVALITGLVLGIGSRWGVFRYPWVVAKLCLIVAVMLVGAVVIGPGLELARQGSATGESMLIAGAMFDVAALATATVLSVYKPGRPFRSRRNTLTTSERVRRSLTANVAHVPQRPTRHAGRPGGGATRHLRLDQREGEP